MKLEKKDYKEMLSMIEEGDNSFEYEKGGEVLTVSYFFKSYGYYEDNTGGWVETDRTFCVYNVECCDEDGQEVETDFDEDTLKKLVP